MKLYPKFFIHSKIGTISQNIEAWISFGSKIPVMKKIVTETAAYLSSKKRFIIGKGKCLNAISSQMKVNDFWRGRVKRPKRKTLFIDLLVNHYFFYCILFYIISSF